MTTALSASRPGSDWKVITDTLLGHPSRKTTPSTVTHGAAKVRLEEPLNATLPGVSTRILKRRGCAAGGTQYDRRVVPRAVGPHNGIARPGAGERGVQLGGLPPPRSRGRGDDKYGGGDRWETHGSYCFSACPMAVNCSRKALGIVPSFCTGTSHVIAAPALRNPSLNATACSVE